MTFLVLNARSVTFDYRCHRVLRLQNLRAKMQPNFSSNLRKDLHIESRET